MPGHLVEAGAVTDLSLGPRAVVALSAIPVGAVAVVAVVLADLVHEAVLAVVVADNGLLEIHVGEAVLSPASERPVRVVLRVLLEEVDLGVPIAGLPAAQHGLAARVDLGRRQVLEERAEDGDRAGDDDG